MSRSNPSLFKLLVFGYISQTEKEYKLFMIVPHTVYDLIFWFYPKLIKFELYLSTNEKIDCFAHITYPKEIFSTFNTQMTQHSNGRCINTVRLNIGAAIGKERYSWIRKGIHVKNGRIVALKFTKRRLNLNGEWNKSQQKNIKNEIEVLKCLRHKNIMHLLAYDLNLKYTDRNGKSQDVILLVSEYAAGGELFDLFYYTEKLESILARTYFRQLLAAIEYMHKNGIIHRDIKPQNLLLDKNYNLIVTGFGLSKIDATGNSNIKMNNWDVGTAGYQAPEILLRKKDYNKKVDIFAMGVVLFIVLGGYPPFEHAKESDKWYRYIVNRKYKSFWKSHRNCGLRQQETDLITRMICFDPDKRISIEKIKKHPWFGNKEILNSSDLIKVLRLRHQRMEQQRNDPNKQKILQHSTHHCLMRHGVHYAVQNAGKKINDLPPPLPEDETINPFDIYTSTYWEGGAYQVLETLECAIIETLNGKLFRSNYGEIDEYDDEQNSDEIDDYGTYVDVVNFSLIFEAAMEDLNAFTGINIVRIHVGLYYCDTAECNLVKFRRLHGEREQFIKIIEKLSVAADSRLTGLDKKSSKIIAKKQQNDELQDLYNKCFPCPNI